MASSLKNDCLEPREAANDRAFILDTSGGIWMPPPSGTGAAVSRRLMGWSDLAPFAQGYVEAAFASLYDPVFQKPVLRSGPIDFRGVGFSDLDPASLAMVLRRCEARFVGWVLHPNNAAVRRDDKTEGERFWRDQQAGLCKDFRPLTISLNDNGKVELRDTAALTKATGR